MPFNLKIDLKFAQEIWWYLLPLRLQLKSNHLEQVQFFSVLNEVNWIEMFTHKFFLLFFFFFFVILF